MELPFVLGQKIKNVTVVYVERPDTVWVLPPSTQETDALLQQVGGLALEDPLECPVLGSLAAVSFSEDGLVYRAKVESINGDEFMMRFIDYGNTETKKARKLFKLPPFLADHHPLAIKVTLDEVEGSKDSTKNRERVSAKLAKPELEMVVSDCSTPGLLIATFSYNGKIVTFSRKKDNEGTNTKIAEKEPEVLLPPSPTMFSSLPLLALLEGVRITGTVTFVSPQGGIWFSPHWIQEKLAVLAEKIDALGEEELTSDFTPVDGLLGLAKAKDGCLHRARVITTSKSGGGSSDRWTVEFIDFGNIEVVDLVLVYPRCLGLELVPGVNICHR